MNAFEFHGSVSSQRQISRLPAAVAQDSARHPCVNMRTWKPLFATRRGTPGEHPMPVAKSWASEETPTQLPTSSQEACKTLGCMNKCQTNMTYGHQSKVITSIDQRCETESNEIKLKLFPFLAFSAERQCILMNTLNPLLSTNKHQVAIVARLGRINRLVHAELVAAAKSHPLQPALSGHLTAPIQTMRWFSRGKEGELVKNMSPIHQEQQSARRDLRASLALLICSHRRPSTAENSLAPANGCWTMPESRPALSLRAKLHNCWVGGG